MKKISAIALMVLAASVYAQTSPAKKELVAKVLQLQQPGVEAVARNLAEQPAIVMMQRAGQIMQTRTPPEKREAVGKEIQADAKKYVDDVAPLLRERALKLAPTTIGPILDERYTEDELKQVAAFLESPVYRKFQQMGGEMQKALTDKLVAETKGVVEPKLKALDQSMVTRLGLPPAAPADASPATKAPAKAASK